MKPGMAHLTFSGIGIGKKYRRRFFATGQYGQSQKRTGDSGEQIEFGKRPGTPGEFDLGPEHPEREHVEQQMQVGERRHVQEHVGEHLIDRAGKLGEEGRRSETEHQFETSPE
jgi:hypothetical protein